MHIYRTPPENMMSKLIRHFCIVPKLGSSPSSSSSDVQKPRVFSKAIIINYSPVN